MIAPTPGRVVWYYPRKFDTQLRQYEDQPLAAHIAHVWGDRMVNLMVISADGIPHNRTSVPLLQDDDPKPELGGAYCTWMPYQVGQARSSVQHSGPAAPAPHTMLLGSAAESPDSVPVGSTAG